MTAESGPLAVITGANRGLGLGLTRQLTARGYAVVAGCRSPENADELRRAGPIAVVGVDTADADPIMSSRLGSMTVNFGHDLGYNTSKAALNVATVVLAKELGERGVVCVTVHPGWVRTDMGGPAAPLSVDESTGPLAELACASAHVRVDQLTCEFFV